MSKTRDGMAKIRDGMTKTSDGMTKTTDGMTKTTDGMSKTRKKDVCKRSVQTTHDLLQINSVLLSHACASLRITLRNVTRVTLLD